MTKFKTPSAFSILALLLWPLNGLLAFDETPIEELEILGSKVLSKEKSPYLIDHDILVRPEAELLIEPGVEIRFAPEVGITVRGVLKAEGTPKSKIKFVSYEPIEQVRESKNNITCHLVLSATYEYQNIQDLTFVYLS